MARRITPVGLGTCLISTAVLCMTAPPATAFLDPGMLILSKAGAILRVEPATGNRAELSGPAVGSGIALSSRPIDLVREESGHFVVADFDVQALIRVDRNTGNRTVLASTSVGSGGSFRPGALEIDGDTELAPENFGTLLVWNSNASRIERVDPVTGDRTVVTGSGGTGPVLSGVQDMLRFGKGVFYLVPGIGDPLLDLLVSDSNLDALVLVSSFSGTRVLLSSATRGTGPNFDTPRGIAMVPPPTTSWSGRLKFYVVDSGADAVFEVDYDGDRTILSSSAVGTGPAFDFPFNIWPSADGKGLYVTDFALNALFYVDLATGDRSILADASTGSGPTLAGARSLTAVPVSTLVWGFEGETPGSPPAHVLVPGFPPSFYFGDVTVENAADFGGSVEAAEGGKVLYLTSGPGDRADPASVTGQHDESRVPLFISRGQNAPRRLTLAVDYLTNEGSEPDPTDVYAFSYGALWSTPLSLLSMQAVNPSSSPFGGGSYTALTGFAEGPITGPDGSYFGEGHVGYQTYEFDLDFPGGTVFLRVADQTDGHYDTAVVVDNVRFVPEPGGYGLVAGLLLLGALVRRRRG